MGLGYNAYGQLGDGTFTNKSRPVQAQLSNVKTLASGEHFAMAIAADGTLWSWGANWNGELGIGSTTNQSTPHQVSGMSGVTAVAPGYSHTLALTSDGKVWAWGSNSYGQLGDGTTTGTKTPKEITELQGKGIVAVAVGYYQSFAVDAAGDVWAWGYNGSGQLGDGTTTNRSVPVKLTTFGQVKQLAAADSHTLALLADGTVWAWGSNGYGQLGSGGYTSTKTPQPVPGLSGVRQVSARYEQSAALTEAGRLWMWGSNSYGRLGDDTTLSRTTPVQLALEQVAAVSLGTYHTVAVMDDGRIWSWGYNYYGQLGRGTTVDRYAPVEVMFTDGSVSVEVTSEGSPLSSAAVSLISQDGIRTDPDAGGGTYTFGGLASGDYIVMVQADGKTAESRRVSISSAAPASSLQVALSDAPAGPVSGQVENGSRFSLALKADGSVYSWGYNYYGQLGTGDTNERTEPFKVLEQAAAIATGSDQAAAVKQDGTLWMWGYANNGQFGNGSGSNRSISTPQQVPGITGVKSAAIGSMHAAAVKGDGTVWTWGGNGSGQLGDGSLMNRTYPVQVSKLTETGKAAVQVAAGSYFTAALLDDGTVWTWGDNGYGQLGDGTNESSLEPKQVSALAGKTIVAIEANETHMFALAADGEVYGWGYNGYGTLGDGTYTSQKSPVQITALSGRQVTKLSSGSVHTLALTAGGDVYVWGSNSYGLLGTNTYDSLMEPTLLTALHNVASVSAGGYHSTAIRTDGTIWAWGNNEFGQLGRGTKVVRISPAQVKEAAGSVTVHVEPAAVAADDFIVQLVSEDGVLTKTVQDATAAGTFVFGNLAPDTYTVAVIKNGFLAESQSAAVSGADTPVTFNLTPDPAGAAFDRRVAATENYTLYTRSDGTVWGYGYNYYGVLGGGVGSTYRTSPVQIVGLTGIKELAAGTNHAVAVRSDGTVWTWGYNGYGQLGDGSKTNRSAPVQVPGLTHIIAVRASDSYTMALQDNGTVWVWGYNGYGQLGDGTTTTRLWPQRVSGLPTIQAISVTADRAYAVETDGDLYGWGYSTYGLLGSGAAANQKQLTPILVTGLGFSGDVRTVTAASDRVFVQKTDDRLYGWGA